MGGKKMLNLKYEKELTALLVIDPYNDFIPQGGKVWDRLKIVAEANDCTPHMLQVLTAARKAELRVFYALHHRYRPGDYETWSILRPSRRQLGRERHSNTAPVVARSARNLRLWRRSIGVLAALPIRIWICSSKSTASTSSS
jgi:hypothetical protein